MPPVVRGKAAKHLPTLTTRPQVATDFTQVIHQAARVLVQQASAGEGFFDDVII